MKRRKEKKGRKRGSETTLVGTCSPPLSNVDGFHHPGDLVDKCDGTCDVVDDGHISDLLPRHGHVLQQLEHSMRHVLKGTGRQEREGRGGGGG